MPQKGKKHIQIHDVLTKTKIKHEIKTVLDLKR